VIEGQTEIVTVKGLYGSYSECHCKDGSDRLRPSSGPAEIKAMFDEDTINEADRRLKAAAPAGSQVIPFGSHARGGAGEDSDLDFLVIEPEVQDVVQESVRLYRALNGLKVWADVIVRSEHSGREWRDVYGTVINSALREGLELAA
jgi:predicted nucleotidyltransferase